MPLNSPRNMYGVIRRVVPSHGVKVGCATEEVARALFREDADTLADTLQIANPNEEHAVFGVVFHRWTKP